MSNENKKPWAGENLQGKTKKPSRSMYSPYESQSQPEEQKKSCKQLFNEALKLKFWIFDPKTKQWYTPEEFLEQNERITSGNEAFLNRLEIKDPLEAIKQANERILELRQRADNFSMRVAEYYKGKVK